MIYLTAEVDTVVIAGLHNHVITHNKSMSEGKIHIALVSEYISRKQHD